MTSIKKVIVISSAFVLSCSAFIFSAQQQQWRAIFAHGLGGNAEHMIRYQNFIGCDIIGENGPEVLSLNPRTIDPRQSCLAQDNDIAVVTRQIRAQEEQNPLVLMGVSKGAATMINTIGWLADNQPQELNKIKAVILDSPFASPESVGVNVAYQNTCSLMPSPVAWLASSIAIPQVYRNYDPHDITPIKAITNQWHKVDRNLVIVFIHSTQDTLISYRDSRRLYGELKKLGFNNLYLIQTRGEHGKIFWGPSQEMIRFNLYAIYRKHDLPMPDNFTYDFYPEEKLFRTIQPSVYESSSSLLSIGDGLLIASGVGLCCFAAYKNFFSAQKNHNANKNDLTNSAHQIE